MINENNEMNFNERCRVIKSFRYINNSDFDCESDPNGGTDSNILS